MKKFLTILLNAIVLFGFSTPTDTIPPLNVPQSGVIISRWHDNVEIYDLLGKTILSKVNPDSRINISSLPEGIYIL